MDTDVNGLEVLSRAESVTLLESQEVGRLMYTRRGLPAVVPVNYTVRGDAVLIWTNSGTVLAQAVRGAVVAFEADELDRATRSGWVVTVTGVETVVNDPRELEQARSHGPVPWATGVGEYLIRVPLTIVHGRWLGARKPRPMRPGPMRPGPSRIPPSAGARQPHGDMRVRARTLRGTHRHS
jgi:hypothetical protein